MDNNLSLKETLYNLIKGAYPDKLHSGLIERYAMNAGYKASNAGRRCRELENKGRIKVEYNEKHHALYQWIPPDENPAVVEIRKILAEERIKNYNPQIKLL